MTIVNFEYDVIHFVLAFSKAFPLLGISWLVVYVQEALVQYILLKIKEKITLACPIPYHAYLSVFH